jgi:hypothetical protein
VIIVPLSSIFAIALVSVIHLTIACALTIELGLALLAAPMVSDLLTTRGLPLMI